MPLNSFIVHGEQARCELNWYSFIISLFVYIYTNIRAFATCIPPYSKKQRRYTMHNSNNNYLNDWKNKNKIKVSHTHNKHCV